MEAEKIFTDVASGATSLREGLDAALAFMRPGDALVVWKLDRLGRSLKHLIDVVTDLEKREVEFCSLQESIDTTTSGGKLIFHVFGALAEFERDLIRDRTRAGLDAARARGKRGGRKRALTGKQIAMAAELMRNPNTSVVDVCKMFNVSKATLYRHVSANGSG